ncbi:MAG: hypothetical protein ACLSFO_05910 [Anaerovoracaceae bacterium]
MEEIKKMDLARETQDLLEEKTEIIKENKPELEFIRLTDEERQAFIDASMPVETDLKVRRRRRHRDIQPAAGRRRKIRQIIFIM